MTSDDDLETRLRTALTRPRSSDRVDTGAFLARVHRGARVRRVKRGAFVAVACTLVLVGGGAAVNAGDLLDSSTTPAADRPDPHPTPPASRSYTRPSHPPPPPTVSGEPTTPSVGQPPSSSAPPATGPVTIAPGGPLAASEVQPLSITATGTVHQWVLAQTPGRDCAAASCASVFSTGDHGSSWRDLGQLPAPPAASGAATPQSVSQLRFAARDASAEYDGWAFGQALWSTHDSGRTWSAADSPAGAVTALEAWGGYAYAAVSSPVAGDDTATLYRTPTATDQWAPTSIGVPLTSVSALAAAKGVVGLIDTRTDGSSVLYVSADGSRWTLQHSCPTGTDPSSLSTAADSASGVSALWVTCTDATSTVLRYTDTTALGTWHDVKTGALSAGVEVAARGSATALVAGGNVTGIEEVTPTAAPRVVYPGPLGVPIYFGFTNSTYGYLLTSDGAILSTTDGSTWVPSYAVSATP